MTQRQEFEPVGTSLASAMKLGNWLDPLNRIIWRAAIKDRKTEMTLRDRRVFKLKYVWLTPFGDQDKKARKIKVEYVWVCPRDGFVPCGWFQVEKFLKGDNYA